MAQGIKRSNNGHLLITCTKVHTCLKADVHCARSSMDPTHFKRCFKNPRIGQSQFSCNIARLLHSSFHSRSYITFTCLRLYSPWETGIHKCHRCQHFMTHTNTAPIVETGCCMIDRNQNNAVRLPLHQYHLGCYRQWGIRVLLSIPCVYTLPSV